MFRSFPWFRFCFALFLTRLVDGLAPARQDDLVSTWDTLLTNLQTSPVMVTTSEPTNLSFHNAGVNITSAAWEVVLHAANGTQLFSTHGIGMGSARLPPLGELSGRPGGCAGCLFTWQARYETSDDWSPPQVVFTAPWGGKHLDPQGMWAPDNATGNGPEFVFLRAELPLIPDTLESALLFLTADGPGRARGTRPLLGGYKAWVGSTLVGIGPGRSKCALTPLTGPAASVSPILCPKGPEFVFDGFDVTALLSACLHQRTTKPNSCSIFIEAYGYDQPRSDVQAAVMRRVAAELVLRFTNGTCWSSSQSRTTCGDSSLVDTHQRQSSMLRWSSYDADSIYLENLWRVGGGGHSENQLGSSGGGSWYYAPHEYIDMSRMPSDTPLSYIGVGMQAHNRWQPAVMKSPFRNVVVRTVPPVQVLPRMAARVQKIASGVYSFDMGREMQGGIMLTVNFSRPLMITVRFAEELLKRQTSAADSLSRVTKNDACIASNTSFVGRVCFNMRTGSRYEDVWILPPGKARVQNHEYIEGRYGELIFNDSSVSLSDIQVGAWVVRQRYDRAASMLTSSPELNDIWEMCRYTSEATSLDLYSDSNARQRSVDCMADDNTAMRLAYATSSSLALQNWAMKQALTTCGTGNLGPGKCRAEWTVLPLIMVRDDLLMTGDLSFARKHFNDLVPNALGSPNSSWPTDPRTGLIETADVLIDWPPGMQDRYVLTERNSVANAFAFYGLTTLAEIAGWLGRSTDQAIYSARAEKLKAAINKLMFNGTAFCDGICSDTPHTSFHSSVYMLAFGAVAERNIMATWKYIRSRINPRSVTWPPPPPLDEHDGMPCGTYVSQFVLQALYKGNSADHGQTALSVLTSNAKNTWTNMIHQGATTTMEMWTPDEKPNLTWSHPWSASPGFIIAWFLFGIQALAPGWSRVAIKPAPGTLTHGEYKLPTVKGFIVVSFASDGDSSFHLSVSLPLGMDARVSLPRRGTLLQTDNLVMLMDGAVVDHVVEDSHVTVQSVSPGLHSFALVPAAGLSTRDHDDEYLV